MEIFAFIFGLLFIPLVLWFARTFGLYTVVRECEAQVFTLFGKVIGTINKPGLRFPWIEFGPRAALLPFFGKKQVVSTALKQYYLRNLMVNSEEGTPMGVGIWYEMQVTNAPDYLFINSDPEGSLQANVASSTISTLSNLEMDKMLEDRHSLSRSVRATVTPLSEKWGYRLGSVYIRKVAFTDSHMVDNITDKVVKRLIQVTSAMKQDGENRVGLIKSETANKVSQKLAEASATRPEVVGRVLNEIAQRDPEILGAVLDVVETEYLLKSDGVVDIIPSSTNVLLQLSESSNGGGSSRALREVVPGR
ncbi:MAG: SPFH domain-containing protein [Bdellovibrionales bacterium]|nr:SPFH domain-containing protein [Bdellovibrionales bacterium]